MSKELYSERNRATNTKLIYHYLPDKFKNQIIHILREFFIQVRERDNSITSYYNLVWNNIGNLVCKEHGLLTLKTKEYSFDRPDELFEKYFLRLNKIEEEFDVIEIAFRFIKKTPELITHVKYKYSPEDAISDLNKRFRQNSVGFKYEQGMILRVDNELLHVELVTRTLELSSNNVFINANAEFISSLNHLKNDRNKESINDALNAFESTLKIICKELNWEYDPKKDTSSKLISICLEQELVPDFLQSHFTGIRTTLESGIPTIRNKRTGHGQGAEEIVIPHSLATYSVFITGACINYLIELYNEKKAANMV